MTDVWPLVHDERRALVLVALVRARFDVDRMNRADTAREPGDDRRRPRARRGRPAAGRRRRPRDR